MSFRNLNPLAKQAVDKAAFDAKVDPMKQMLVATKDLVQAEIGRHAQGSDDYAVVIKSYAAEYKGNEDQQIAQEVLQGMQQDKPDKDQGIRQKEHLYKSIDKQELQNLFAKVDSGEDLTPREIQIFSELANAVQKEEFVLNLGDRVVCPQEHAARMQYDIENGLAQVAKVKNLGVERLNRHIGRDADGNIRVGARDEVRGAMYNILDDDLENLDQAYGGQQGILDEDLEIERSNIYSVDELAQLGRARRESYSDEFKQGIVSFNAQYPLSNRVTYDSSSDEPITDARTKGFTESALQSVLKQRGNAGEIMEQIQKWRTLIDGISQSRKHELRMEEKHKDREARVEQDADDRYTMELDEKQKRILEEWLAFSADIRFLEDPSSLAGKDV